MPVNKCIICRKEFYVKPFHAKKGWGKFCSIECRSKGQYNGKWFKCAKCGKKLYRTPRDVRNSKSKIFFCSHSCHCSWANKNIRCGENSPNWIAGVSAYRDLMKRAGIIAVCKKCGIKDKRVLTVHHKDGNRKNNKLVNLEWLCRNCHCLVHWC